MTFFHGIKITPGTEGGRPSPQASQTVIGLVGEKGENKEENVKGLKVNTPFLVDSYTTQQSFTGSLDDSLKAIYAQIRCPVIVVATENGKIAEGIEKLKFTKQETGLSPNIIICPTLKIVGTTTPPTTPAIREKARVTPEKESTIPGTLKEVAGKIGAIAIVDLHTEPTATVPGYADKRVIASWPPVLVSGPVDVNKNPTVKTKPLSPYIAGVIARNDSERGYHTSFSNRSINGLVGLSENIEHSIFDADCTANRLNEKKTMTVLSGPFRTWGNSGLYPDDKPLYKFISTVRTEDQIISLLARGLQWAIDKNITKNFIEELEIHINHMLQTLRKDGVITNGEAWINKEKTTPSAVVEGKIYITVKWTPSFIAQEIIIDSVLTSKFIEEVFKK